MSKSTNVATNDGVDVVQSDDDQNNAEIELSVNSDHFDFNQETVGVSNATNKNAMTDFSHMQFKSNVSNATNTNAGTDFSHMQFKSNVSNAKGTVDSQFKSYQQPMSRQNLTTISEERSIQSVSPFQPQTSSKTDQNNRMFMTMRRQPFTDLNAGKESINNFNTFFTEQSQQNPHNFSITSANQSVISAHNQSSFSASARLAEIDAKYNRHKDFEIKKMTLEDVLASIKLSDRAPSSSINKSERQFKKPFLPQIKPALSPTSTHNTTNISEAATENLIPKSCFISTDKPVLAFGFVDYNMARSLSVKIFNDFNESLWLQPTIQHQVTRNDPNPNVFYLTDTASFTLEPKSAHTVTVVFKPKKAYTYNGDLRLRLMSKDEPEFVIRMFGYGARADLRVFTRNFEKIEMGVDGVGICEIERYARQTNLVLTNKGQRDAFAYIFAVDANDQPLSEDLVSVSPNRVVVQKDTNEYVRLNVTFHQGLHSMTMQRTRSVSRMSTGTSHTTRTLQNESLLRLRIVWGEERLRRRLKCYLSRKTDENVTPEMMTYVVNPFKKEGTFQTEKIVGHWDIDRFNDSLRVMTVQFIDLHIRPQSTLGKNVNQTLASTMITNSP